jgi:hypothetical protein
LTASPAQL